MWHRGGEAAASFSYGVSGGLGGNDCGIVTFPKVCAIYV